ncbi:hypothetical protein CXG81DRAFT_27203 [Caulochytrium protostelioides]|uniref:Outer arm dynein light chain 1 n=1 Tax=Caulochytrium protostelioides TaxID=1555241 RepID=A0A4P9X4Q0_9FUNG|nr:hypothetical protein CXG81DRAFT_27203 [Caulochytrium protostelioides]|eukprot:RKP00068.1 hypothetical protein CXG81DRAFT_27203 [Caulochytrium protostelioides]
MLAADKPMAAPQASVPAAAESGTRSSDAPPLTDAATDAAAAATDTIASAATDAAADDATTATLNALPLKSFSLRGVDQPLKPFTSGDDYLLWRREGKEYDDHGNLLMTPRLLRLHCKEQKLYQTPSLNDRLYLQYKGFTQIDHLDAYTGLKTLWLQGNGIGKLVNLEAQAATLKCLFAQNNCVESLAAMTPLPALDTLNISHNLLKTLDGVADPLPRLHTLTATHNYLRTLDDVRSLAACAELSVLDLSHNRLDLTDAEIEALINDVLARMPALAVVHLAGNPFVPRVRNYRRRLIAACPRLTHLDERPVFPNERAQVDAWAAGGMDAENAERARQKQDERDRQDRNRLALARLQEEGRRRRRAQYGDAVADAADVEGHGGHGVPPHLVEFRDAMLRNVGIDVPTDGASAAAADGDDTPAPLAAAAAEPDAHMPPPPPLETAQGETGVAADGIDDDDAGVPVRAFRQLRVQPGAASAGVAPSSSAPPAPTTGQAAPAVPAAVSTAMPAEDPIQEVVTPGASRQAADAAAAQQRAFASTATVPTGTPTSETPAAETVDPAAALTATAPSSPLDMSAALGETDDDVLSDGVPAQVVAAAAPSARIADSDDESDAESDADAHEAQHHAETFLSGASASLR